MMRSKLSTRPPGLVLMAGFLCLGFAMEAAAIVGAPLTPISVAGVARRTTRRVVVASAATSAATTSAATASAASAQAAAASAQASAAQAQSASQASAAQAQAAQATAARPSGAPAVGSVVSALPAGCVSAPSGGIEYQKCGGVYYRAAFQGNNLVYVVQ
jgi:hypothetical protein